ncbi:MAG: hypothetical protein CV087_10225 [Candidatus Brocadia sp. WS118]|nr:MAG: hypothetical protein CV087_10225 [Candidatus Brocadia sp. WS118]
MAYTQLYPNALPGRARAFDAKDFVVTVPAVLLTSAAAAERMFSTPAIGQGDAGTASLRFAVLALTSLVLETISTEQKVLFTAAHTFIELETPDLGGVTVKQIEIPYYDDPLIVGDTFLMKLDPETSLSGATSPKVNYKKPDGTIGSWTGTISNDQIQYQLENGDIDIPGDWTFWPTWVDSNSRNKKGRAMKVAFRMEGTA